MQNNMKTQKELGKVYLRTEGLDVDRFTRLISEHAQEDNIQRLIDGYGFNYVENYFNPSGSNWVTTDRPEEDSKLITLDELERMLQRERTPEVIQSEIEALQKELKSLTEIKVGDCVLTSTGAIGKVDVIDSDDSYLIGGLWWRNAKKIDPNKTVKEVLGLD